MKKNFVFIRRDVVALWLFLMTFGCLTLCAQIKVFQDFDSGSLDLAETRIEGERVVLAGRDNYNSGRWKWIYFDATGVNDLRPTFEIATNFAVPRKRLKKHRFVYSYDGKRWHFFENGELDLENKTYKFFNDKAFTRDRIRVAFSMPYPLERVHALINYVRQSEYSFVTASGNHEMIVGQSPGGISDCGRSIGPNPIYGFAITDTQSDHENKERVVILSGVHSNETPAGHVTEALIHFLLGEQPEAVQLRQQAIFLVYPMVNPDGRQAGYNRGNVQHPKRDTNRFWHEDLYQDMPEIKTVAEAMKRDLGGKQPLLFLDFHSWTDTGNHFIITEQKVESTEFWKKLSQLEPEMKLQAKTFPGEDELRKAGRSTWFAKLRLGATYAMTPETMFRPGDSIPRYKQMGRHFGLAIHQQLQSPKP